MNRRLADATAGCAANIVGLWRAAAHVRIVRRVVRGIADDDIEGCITAQTIVCRHGEGGAEQDEAAEQEDGGLHRGLWAVRNLLRTVPVPLVGMKEKRCPPSERLS